MVPGRNAVRSETGCCRAGTHGRRQQGTEVPRTGAALDGVQDDGESHGALRS